MKEMVGGCCVCSDDRGWTENPLVYCDGGGCTVAVHQACYGIVTVPSGPWFCRKCESQERAARVQRCELCPSKDGALKRTDTVTTGWAHVVCALYIPEVRFGNVSTMEPIILSMVPPERFNKGCYICETQGRESKSKIGACMNCNKQGCKLHFHVTCAQAQGLLCEEAGNYMDNVKYCGYCPHHYGKLKKGANLKTIPAFKPLPPVGAPVDPNASEKSLPIQASGSSWGGQPPPANSGNGSKEKQRKKPGRKSTTQASPKASNNRESSSVIVEGPSANDDSKMKSSKNEGLPFANVLAGVGLVPGPRVSMNDQNNSGVVNRHEPSDNFKQENARNSETSSASGMKKNDKFNDSSKLSGSIPSTSAEGPNTTNKLDKSRTSRRKVSIRSASPTSQGGNDTESTLSNISDPGHASASEQFLVSEQCTKGSVAVKVETPIASEANSSMVHSVIVSSASAVPSENSSTLVQSSQLVPQRAVSPLIISASTSGSSQIHMDQAKSNYDDTYQSVVKESRPLPSAVPAKKPRRGRAPKVSIPVVPDSPPSSPDSAGVEQQPKRRKKATKSTPSTNDEQHRLPAAINRQGDNFMPAHVNQQTSQATENMRRDSPSQNQLPRENLNASKAQEPPVITSFPTIPVMNSGTKDLNQYKDNPSSSIHGKENSHYLIRNGITAPHMLGNQLNPNSSVAQKMTDTLVAEVEAHSVTGESSPISTTNLIGVPFPLRTVSPSLKVPSSGGAPSFPHSLEQLLERQWEQGSQFLMEQAQHFDIASLLSCLHNLKEENMRLEDHVANLHRRRDHLLAVNARLSVPLQSSQMAYATTVTNTPDRSTPGPGHPAVHVALRSSPQERERNNRGTLYMPHMENGISMTEHLSASMAGNAFSMAHGNHRSPASSSHQSDRVVPSPVIVSSRMNSVYHPVLSGGAISIPSTMSPVQGSSSFMSESRNLTVLRSPSSTPEMRPEVARSTPSQLQSSYPYVSPPLSAPTHHPGSYSGMTMTQSNSSSQQIMNARREGSDSRHPVGRPSPIERR
ncbi:protein AF-10-like isoform X1 [Daphnia pulicaria]|uniref:protein AF-10-like isoform X1 n=1 Tax=Daphnia pulicaria TaxID=35523 RepID=UPI001EEA9C19|nr:protein AF-10-like isoform X1 [Daphnia pulicaria]XP_046632444.1 protein AF-10-like isoform X1 [Daphnia pulicaria]